MGLDPDGRERLVVVVKGTFDLVDENRDAPLAAEQTPLVMADEYTGEPGLSAVRYESDFAPFKPRCDVLLNGSAYTSGGRPEEQVRVGIVVGGMQKSFDVFGPRFWARGILGVHPSKPKPSSRMPIGYDTAFGGVDTHPDDSDKIKACMDNPVGTGYFPYTPAKQLEGRLMPNTSEVGEPVKSVSGKYRPMALGVVGRNFKDRARQAGTYDQQWLDRVFPFLPPDFNPLYFQAAPSDQQIDYPRGGEQVVLVNLTPAGRTVFRLPGLKVPVEFSGVDYERRQMDALLDTILIEPDLGRLMCTWRASVPLARNIFEITQVVVGKMSKAWYRARELGKEYYPSLSEYIRLKKERIESGQFTQEEHDEDEREGEE